MILVRVRLYYDLLELIFYDISTGEAILRPIGTDFLLNNKKVSLVKCLGFSFT